MFIAILCCDSKCSIFLDMRNHFKHIMSAQRIVTVVSEPEKLRLIFACDKCERNVRSVLNNVTVHKSFKIKLMHTDGKKQTKPRNA